MLKVLVNSLTDFIHICYLKQIGSSYINYFILPQYFMNHEHLFPLLRFSWQQMLRYYILHVYNDKCELYLAF